MTVPYDKPFLSVSAQVALLQSNGMYVADAKAAEGVLSAVGYYRFSGYSYSFRRFPTAGEGHAGDVWQTRLSDFAANTSFSAVTDIYEFDRQVRMRVFDGIEKFEIAFRFIVGHLLAQRGQFAHRVGANLDYEFTKTKKLKFIERDGSCSEYESTEHAAWLGNLDKQEMRSQEAFAVHHVNKYGAPLPLWKATEVMSFGTLVRLFGGLKQPDREQIAAELDVLDSHGVGDSKTLSNWLNHIRYMRNSSAHHARLWNRNFDVILVETPAIPELSHLSREQHTHLYGTIAILSFLLARTHPKDNWRERTLKHLTDGAAELKQGTDTMGFPAAWESEPIWSSTYGRDEVRAARVRLLSKFDTYTSGEAILVLHEIELKLRKSNLTYLRRKHALLGLKIAQTHRYPVFQFDANTGNIHPLVVEVNRRLYVSMFDAADDEVVWSSAAWWSTPNAKLDGDTPVLAFGSGKFSIANLDNVLPGSPEDPPPVE